MRDGQNHIAFLIEGAHLLPCCLYTIYSSREPEKSFGMQISDLRELVVNLGFATRVIFATLFDDVLLGVPSVLALTVTMPELFRQGLISSRHSVMRYRDCPTWAL